MKRVILQADSSLIRIDSSAPLRGKLMGVAASPLETDPGRSRHLAFTKPLGPFRCAQHGRLISPVALDQSYTPSMPEIYGSDAYSPQEVAQKVENIGVAKATAPFIESLMLGILAGGFVGLGGLYSTLILADTEMSLAAVRVLSGLVFAIGYVVAILSGAEVFTSNNLLAMTWAARKISTFQLLRHWSLILVANGIGALGLILLFIFSGLPVRDDHLLGRQALEIAVNKISLPLIQVFFLAVLGNLFVCVSVWIAMAGRSVSDKVISMILPLSALGALGLEHVLATLYYLPRAMLTSLAHPEISIPGMEALTITAFLANLAVVTLGNIVGGTFMVALVYHFVYRHNPRHQDN